MGKTSKIKQRKEIMETFNQAAYEVANNIVEMLIRKQKDYGKDNINVFGEYGILVRATDKIMRLRNLIEKAPLNEKKEETWADLAGYAILALMYDAGDLDLPVE